MNEETFPIRYFLPSKFHQNFLELSFTQETSKWVPVQISFESSHWIFNVCPGFWPFVSWKTYPKIHRDILTEILSNLGASSIFTWVFCRYGVSCLSIAVWWSCHDIHYFCCCHLRRRRALLSKDCKGSRVAVVTSEHDSSCTLLKFWF